MLAGPLSGADGAPSTGAGQGQVREPDSRAQLVEEEVKSGMGDQVTVLASQNIDKQTLGIQSFFFCFGERSITVLWENQYFVIERNPSIYFYG